MKHDLHHLAILVPDLDAAISSFAPFDSNPERHKLQAAGLEIGVVRLGTVELHLICPTDEEGEVARLVKERGPFVHHLGVGIDSIEDEMKRLATEGMPPVSDPQLTAEGLREVFVQFPPATGVALQLVEDKRDGDVGLIDGGVADAVRSVIRKEAK